MFGDKCKCIYCGGTKLQTWGKQYQPAFCGSKIHWILYDRVKCENKDCKRTSTDGITFTTIDSRFLKVLPNYISSNFKYIFPKRGPGIHTDMVKALSCFTDKHVLFGAFADYVNNLQWTASKDNCSSSGPPL